MSCLTIFLHLFHCPRQPIKSKTSRSNLAISLPLDRDNEEVYNLFMRMRNIRNMNSKTERHLVTTQRQLLLNLIRDADGHIDARELYRCANSKDTSISLATVYRTLHLFRELGLVDERHLGQVRCYYEIKRLPEHQHLLCRKCGKVIEFQSSLIHKLVNKTKQEYGFDVTKAELHMEGYCQQCKEKTEEAHLGNNRSKRAASSSKSC